ncbi:MAG: TIGR02281 family clan AA aspartic protease [Sphingopyxis sp.]
MVGRLFLIVGSAAVVFAIFGPQLGERAMGLAQGRGDTAGPASLPSSSSLPAGSSGTMPTSGGAAVTLLRDGDSHFRAGMMVNGRPITMLVDSGATLVVLTQADAQAAGITPAAADYTGRARTAGGEVAMAPVTIDRITLGGIERRNVAAAVMPGNALGQSLLGQSFLGQLAEVSIADNRMRLR